MYVKIIDQFQNTGAKHNINFWLFGEPSEAAIKYFW